MRYLSVFYWTFLLIAAVGVSACSIAGSPLSLVDVGSPAINCIFDSDCVITASELSSPFVPPGGTGDGALQSSIFPTGEAGTQAEGLHAYLYRIDLRNTAGVTAQSCVTDFSIDFGPIVSLDYDGDGSLDNAFVVTSGDSGNVRPAAVTQSGETVTVSFEPAVCPGTQVGNGDSSYLFGLTSVFPPATAIAQLTGTLGLSESLDAYAPDFVSASSGPVIDVTPDQGDTGATMTIRGAGFVPGGYTGTVLWDNGEIGTFAIPSGGAFVESIIVPTGASVGEHTITVCSLNPCATGDFEQRASAPFVVTGPRGPLVPLNLWWSPGREDNASFTAPGWTGAPGDTRTPDYEMVLVEGYVFNPDMPQPTGTLPLYRWWSPSRGDNFTTADPDWAGAFGDPDRSPDYAARGIIGYIHEDPGPGRVPLHSWFDADRGDNFITAQSEWHGSAGETRLPNYEWVRLEGYIEISTVPVTPTITPTITPTPETPTPETPTPETPTPETPIPETPIPETPTPETPTSEPTDPVSDTAIHIWHAWDGDAESVLNGLSFDAYQSNSVALRKFENESELMENLRSVNDFSVGPHIILGTDAVADELLGLRFTDAYCLPGACPACEGPNPPEWCRRAYGDFSATINPQFNLAGLCADVGDCPCVRPNPPNWCWAAQLAPEQLPEGGIDVFQASFARQFDEEIFPIGTPIDWNYLMVVANPDWFIERQITTPQSLLEIIELANQQEALLRLFDPGYIDPDPDALQPLIDLAKGDPSPQPSDTGIWLVPANRFSELSQLIEFPVLMALDDYTYQPRVQGSFVNTNIGTEERQAALNVAYQIAKAETQEVLTESANILPTNGAVWQTLDESVSADLAEVSVDAFIDELLYMDFSGTAQNPDYEPIEADSDCQDLGREYYQELVESGLDVVNATFSANARINQCDNSLRRVELSSGVCSQLARITFFNTFQATQSMHQAEVAAREQLASCREGTLSVDPDSGGSGTWTISETLSATLTIPADALEEPLDFVVTEGAELTAIPIPREPIGKIFSINAARRAAQERVNQFRNPFKIRVRYDEDDVDDKDEENLALFFWDVIETRWVEIDSDVDPTGNTIEAELDHLTTFSIQERGAVTPDPSEPPTPTSNRGVYLPFVSP